MSDFQWLFILITYISICSNFMAITFLQNDSLEVSFLITPVQQSKSQYTLRCLENIYKLSSDMLKHLATLLQHLVLYN